MNSKWVKSREEKRKTCEQREILCVKGSKDFSKNQEEEDEELTIRGI